MEHVSQTLYLIATITILAISLCAQAVHQAIPSILHQTLVYSTVQQTARAAQVTRLVQHVCKDFICQVTEHALSVRLPAAHPVQLMERHAINASLDFIQFQVNAGLVLVFALCVPVTRHAQLLFNQTSKFW